MPKTSAGELDLARLRTLARKKPRTKAGQVRQAWPEIRQLLAAGHSLKDVWAWLREIGIAIPYTRLSEYVNQLRRRDAAPKQVGIASPQAASIVPVTSTGEETSSSKKAPHKLDPLENVRRSEASRPGFHYRAAKPADEKDLI